MSNSDSSTSESRPPLQLIIGLLIPMFCALMGYLLAEKFGSHFVHPQSINRTVWHVVSPGMNESVNNPTLGYGTHVVDGAFTISRIALHSSDKLSLLQNPALKEFHLQLAPNSGRANIKLKQDASSPTIPVIIVLEPNRFAKLGNQV